MVIDLIASLLLGSGLSTLISPKLISFFHLNFFSSTFSQSIPSFSSEIVSAKNLDLTDFGLTLIISFVIFAFNYFASRNKSKPNLFNYWYLVFAFLVFLQTHFVFTSGTTMLAFVTLVQVIYLFVKTTHLNPIINFDWTILANGIFFGFYLLLLANKITTVPSGLLFIFISLPFFFICFNYLNKHIFKSPGYLILLLSLFNPLSIIWLIIVGLTSLIFVIFLRHKSVYSLLYIFAVIFLFAFNPLYFVGNFDSVEEGFWSAWNQRLFLDQVPYRDFLAYHPPFLMWGLNIFSQLFGFTLKNQKLFFHLLQIGGLFSFYLLSRLLIKKPLHQILLVLIALSFSGTLVSNNFEIRLGFGLLAITFWAYKKPLLSGVFTAIALFTSLEVGLVTMLVLTLAHLKSPVRYILGVAVVTIPMVLYLFLKGALPGLISQLAFYSQAFSSGYFNFPVSRQFLSAYLHWHIFNQYISADFPVLWEATRLISIGALLYSGATLIQKKSTTAHLLVFVLSVFSLGLFRSALGRSDFYHLLPLIWLSLLFIFHYLEKYSLLVIIIVLLVFARSPINASYLENYFYRLQTYGRVIGEWDSFASSRSGLVLSQTPDTHSYNQLLKYISDHTSISDTIFIYPWDPQLYFLSNRRNSTSLDTPYAFFTSQYQQQTIQELKDHPPKFIIYNSQKYFGNMKPESLPLLTGFIEKTYVHELTYFGNYRVLTP